MQAKGGAEGVGRVTTSSVVTSIFLVIIADSLMALILYL
jgi:phospholipid/cholesterol/gamma-HCH transport system permease protein